MPKPCIPVVKQIAGNSILWKRLQRLSNFQNFQLFLRTLKLVIVLVKSIAKEITTRVFIILCYNLLLAQKQMLYLQAPRMIKQINHMKS